MRLRSIFRRSPHIHGSSGGVGSGGAPTSSACPVLNEPSSSVEGETAGGMKSSLSVAGTEVTAPEGSNGDGGLCDSVPPSPGVLTVIERKPSSRSADN